MITNEEIMERIAERYRDIITAINKGDNEELKALSVSSIASDDDFTADNKIRFDERGDLSFVYKGMMYGCIPGVGILDNEELRHIAETIDECHPIFSDVYFIMQVGNVEHMQGEDYDYQWQFVGYYFGATADLERHGEVPGFVLEAIDRWLEEKRQLIAVSYAVDYVLGHCSSDDIPTELLEDMRLWYDNHIKADMEHDYQEVNGGKVNKFLQALWGHI